MSRDKDAARKFAVKWSTSSKGEIANLAGCHLRALDDLAKLRRQCRELIKHWDEAHEFKADETGLWRGIEEIRELLKGPQCLRDVPDNDDFDDDICTPIQEET